MGCGGSSQARNVDSQAHVQAAQAAQPGANKAEITVSSTSNEPVRREPSKPENIQRNSEQIEVPKAGTCNNPYRLVYGITSMKE